MAEGGEDHYSSSDDDSDISLFDLDDDDDDNDADWGRNYLCYGRKHFQRPMQALRSCHLNLCLSLGFLVS